MPDPDAARPKKGHYLLKATTAVLLLAIAYKYTTDAKAVSEAAAAASAVTLPSTVSTRISWDNGGQGGLGIAGGIGDISAAEMSDLTNWVDEEEVDFASIFAAAPGTITPYTLDVARKRVIFVEIAAEELEASVTSGDPPFVYQAQRKYAKKAYGVPFSTLADMMQVTPADGWDKDVLLLHSTGRCGSTLLSKLLGTAGAVRSLSEPDIYTNIAFYEIDQPTWATQDEKEAVVKAVTFVLRQQSVAASPESSKLCLKFRSQVVYSAELLQKALPNAKSVFLYRNPVDTIDSFSALFFKDAAANFFRWLHFDSWFIYNVLPFGEFMPFLAPLTETQAATYMPSLYKPMGILGFNAICYLSNMDAALSLVQNTKVFSAVIRYEDLIKHRASVVTRVLDKCGMLTASSSLDSEATAKVFDEDAHADGPVFMQKADVEALNTLIGTHKELTAIDFILPQTEKDY
eukprot:gene10337-6920_t